jgi:multidrug efflux system membrane fusion protein
VGDKVTVRLSDNSTVEATVTAIGTVKPGKGNDPATVPVTLAVADQQRLRALDDGAQVDVSLVAERRDDVLTVPVAALLALAEGGFGVQVLDASGGRIVPVETGMYANGRVEVRSPDLTPGMSVGVPA